jgi:hypothetical protein
MSLADGHDEGDLQAPPIVDDRRYDQRLDGDNRWAGDIVTVIRELTESLKDQLAEAASYRAALMRPRQGLLTKTRRSLTSNTASTKRTQIVGKPLTALPQHRSGSRHY